MRRIVVGTDGSDPSVAALAWTVRLARTVGAQVEVVTAAAQLPLADPFGAGWVVADAVASAREAQQAALSRVEHEDVELDARVEEGQPAGVLLGASDGADLLVVGTHGHGALESALLGSVGPQLVPHAACPAVVVPEDPGAVDRIVVGVDGSEEALHALRWAAGLARVVEADVELVAAYHAAPIGIGSPWVAPVETVGEAEMRQSALNLLDTAVERADAADVVIERTAVSGPAATRLRDRAEEAHLLVVGSRGHGGFTGLLLGSVSRRCLAHPPCPVVVVPSH